MLKATAAGLAAILTWATVFVVGRYGLLRWGVEPVHFLWMRYAAAVPVMWLVVALRGELPRAREELGRRRGLLLYALLGLSGCFGMSWFQAMALPYVQATTLSLIMSTAPVMTVFFGCFAGERPGWRGGAGLLLGMAGAAMIILSMSGAGRELARPPWPYYGELMAFLSGTSWALYTVLGRDASRRAGGLVAATLAVSACALYLLAGAPALWRAGLPGWRGMAAMLYMGVVPTALGFALWYYALERLPAGRLALLQYLAPGMAYLMALAALGETVRPGAVAGFLLAVFAVWLALGGRLPAGGRALARRLPRGYPAGKKEDDAGR